jgi:glutamate-5-semialdehyde dehydrogenase
MENRLADLAQVARNAKAASYLLAQLETETKNRLLRRIAELIESQRDRIASANAQDVERARAMVNEGSISQPLLNRLILSDPKIDQLTVYLNEVARLSDPVGHVQYAMQLDEQLELTRVSTPIGVVAIIFESRPEVVIQVSALSLKSGNAAILKGGREAGHTNRILFDIIDIALKEYDLEHAVNLIETREDVAALLKLEHSIDLIIPRGSNEFVRYIQENTKIPVMGHSEGVCHVFLDAECDPLKAHAITLDAKLDYPSACNAMETLLVHESAVGEVLPNILSDLVNASVRLLGCERTIEHKALKAFSIQPANESDWETEYTDLILSIKIVPSVEAAIAHVNRYGSHHTDAIVTENNRNATLFLNQVDSACVFHNASTRFSDGYVFGLGAEVGISTNKTHARGPVGLEGMVIYKYLLRGCGQKRADYSGQNAKPFLHRRHPITD